MQISKVQAIIGILIVVSVLAVASIIVLAPIFSGNPADKYIDVLQTWANLFTGTLGIVAGYFFGKQKS